MILQVFRYLSKCPFAHYVSLVIFWSSVNIFGARTLSNFFEQLILSTCSKHLLYLHVWSYEKVAIPEFLNSEVDHYRGA